MNSITACPYCATAFKVTEDQLRVRSGDVRCGQCGKVFNAYASLGSLGEIQTENPPLDSLAEPPVTPPVLDCHDSPSSASEKPTPEDSTEPQPGEPVPKPPAEERLFIRKRASSRLWLAGSAVLFLLMVMQGVYFYRNVLVLANPALAPQLEKMCAILRCYLGPEQRPEKIDIEASDLQADPTDSSVIVFTATLRNHDRVALAHPTLELALTDVEDRMVARKLFAPEDYVGTEEPLIKAGIRPGSEFPVELTLNMGGIKASGYRLYLFYPRK